MALPWTEDLATGEYIIDNHHKNIFKVANDMEEAINEGKGDASIGMTLQFLECHVVKHFHTEEDFMKKYNYN